MLYKEGLDEKVFLFIHNGSVYICHFRMQSV